MDALFPPALVAVMCRALGLTKVDLAELGGFSESTAQKLLQGKLHPSDDVMAALNEIKADVEWLAEQLYDELMERGGGDVACYRNNEELRSDGAMTARGKAAGGFAGPYLVAAFQAIDDFGEGANPVFD